MLVHCLKVGDEGTDTVTSVKESLSGKAPILDPWPITFLP